MNDSIRRRAVPRLAEGEEQVWIPSHRDGLALFLRYLPPARDRGADGRVVLYVHGGTFPSSVSIAHRFDDRSWRDALGEAGFHVWGLDFLGFGESDRYPEMAAPAESRAALGRTEEAGRQIERAVAFLCARHDVPCVSLIAHSWGSMAAGRFATDHPERVGRMVLFGPIVRRRNRSEAPAPLPAWRLVSLEDQWRRFTADVPEGEAPVLDRRHFASWGEAYLDSDPKSRFRMPPAVQVPSGPFQDIQDAWTGSLAYDPQGVRAPVAIVRGEWDSWCTDPDAAWLGGAFAAAREKQDVKIPRATHLLHLEKNREILYQASIVFLESGS